MTDARSPAPFGLDADPSETLPSTAGPAPASTSPAALESVERLELVERLSYGHAYNGRIFQASRPRPVLLVAFDPLLEADPAVASRLLGELRAASRWRGPSIAHATALFRSDGRLYAAFEGMTGVSLATGFEFLGRAGLRLSAEAALRIAGGVLSALEAAATAAEDPATTHGLITPENIFVAEGQKVFLRGFGVWASAEKAGVVASEQRRYLAPVQNRGILVNPRTDLLSLAIVLFEALAGIPAFDGPPEEEDLAELKGEIEQLRKDEPALSDALEIVLACLAAPSATSVNRARLATSIDTLFLQGFAADRPRNALSLEELVAKVRPRRPLIVRAIPLTVGAADPAPEAREPLSPAPQPASAPPPAPTAAVPAPKAAVEASRPAPVAPSRVHRRPVFRTATVASAFLLVAGAVAFLLLRRSRESGEDDRAAAPAFVVRIATAPPAPVASPSANAATDRPLPSPVAAVTPAGPAREARHRPAAVRRPAKPGGPRRSGAAAFEPAAGELSPARAEEPSVAADGSLPLDTPGLVRPHAVAVPTVAWPDRSRTRPSATLELLVDERGLVAQNRILRADRIPPGFAKSVADYVRQLRFDPARLRGAPVRVWITHEMRIEER